MVACSRCGVQNDLDSKFCKNCGEPIAQEIVPPVTPSPPARGDMGQDMAGMGRRMGDNLKEAGERFGRGMERHGSDFGAWWDKSLGVFAPLVVALMGIAGFFVVLLIVGALVSVSDHPAFWDALTAFMETYWWLFFALAFLGAFQGYFRRRWWDFMWVDPMFNGIGSVAWFWILAQVLRMASVDSDHPRLGDLADFVEDMLLVLFILVVIVSYLFAFWKSVSPANWDPPIGN